MKLKGSIVIATHGRKYIMVKHSERKWEFPGGHIEGKETKLEAAKRELKEETGLIGKNWKDCGVAELDNGNLALFSCDVSGTPKSETDEIIETRYFTALPMKLSFERFEYFLLLEMAGHMPKPKTDYDLASQYFDNVRSKSPLHLKDWTNGLIRWGRIGKNSQVLDVGCGTGRYSLEIGKRTGADVTGLDFSRGMLGKANEKECGIWLQGDAANIPFGNESFDTVIMMLMLQHVDDEPRVLAEAKRVLRPGGQFIIATISHARIRRHLMRYFPGAVKVDLNRFMPITEIKWHLTNLGFEKIHHHRVSSQPTESSIDVILDRFRNRYISTLSLVSEEDFEDNFKIFEDNLRMNYGQTVKSHVDMTFIEAKKN